MSDSPIVVSTQPTQMDTFEFGKFYKDSLSENINGICICITYHLSGCTTVTLFKDKKRSGNYEVTATRIEGFTGDPTAHTKSAQEYLGKKVKHRYLDLEGVVTGYNEAMHNVDSAFVTYMDKMGMRQMAWIDTNLLEFVEVAVQPAPPVHEPGKRVGCDASAARGGSTSFARS